MGVSRGAEGASKDGRIAHIIPKRAEWNSENYTKDMGVPGTMEVLMLISNLLLKATDGGGGIITSPPPYAIVDVSYPGRKVTVHQLNGLIWHLSRWQKLHRVANSGLLKQFLHLQVYCRKNCFLCHSASTVCCCTDPHAFFRAIFPSIKLSLIIWGRL